MIRKTFDALTKRSTYDNVKLIQIGIGLAIGLAIGISIGIGIAIGIGNAIGIAIGIGIAIEMALHKVFKNLRVGPFCCNAWSIGRPRLRV